VVNERVERNGPVELDLRDLGPAGLMVGPENEEFVPPEKLCGRPCDGNRGSESKKGEGNPGDPGGENRLHGGSGLADGGGGGHWAGEGRSLQS